MSTRIRKEEYTTLGDFILPSFTRDQATIEASFPKFNAAFLEAFTAKLNYVKELEASLVLSDEQKVATKKLYDIASGLNTELTKLNSYIKDAGLNNNAVTALKKDLFNRNIEGAILKLEALKQYIITHKVRLSAEGLPDGFGDTLSHYKIKLELQNGMQNEYMNRLKQLTETNAVHYAELYSYISKIAAKGKLLFKNTVVQNEYTISKNISRMRTAKKKINNEPL